MDGPRDHPHATLENNAAELVAKAMKFVKVTLAFFSKIMYNYFSNDPFYRKFDIAVDVKRLTVQRRFSAGVLVAEERDAIRITIVNL